jgi:NitT/TauT family transport system substrate-binding protein
MICAVASAAKREERMRSLQRCLICVVMLVCAVPVWGQTKIDVATAPANDFLPLWIAKEKGLAAKHGLDLHIQVTNPGFLPEALVSGTIQVAILTATTLAIADEQGLDLMLVAGAGIQTEANPRQVLVRPDAGIKAPMDFKGKKVGVPILNASLHVMFKKWLKANGVDPNAATYVEVRFPQMGDLLKVGQVDAVLPVEPFRSHLVQTGIAVPAGDYITSVNQVTLLSFYAATRTWAEANSPTIAALRQVLTEGEQFIAANPDEARAIEAQYLKLSPEAVKNLPFTNTQVVIPPAMLQFWLDTCKELGVTKETADASKYIFK